MSLRVNISGNINESISASVDTTLQSLRANISANAKDISPIIDVKVDDVSIVTDRVANFRIASLDPIEDSSITSEFRANASTIVSDGTNSFRVSLQQIKKMNTKIVSEDSAADADFDKLNKGDFIFATSD